MKLTRKQRAARAAEACMDALCEWRAGKIGDTELQWRTWNACRSRGISTRQPAPRILRPTGGAAR